jgi:hypothetical protein
VGTVEGGDLAERLGDIEGRPRDPGAGRDPLDAEVRVARASPSSDAVARSTSVSMVRRFSVAGSGLRERVCMTGLA